MTEEADIFGAATALIDLHGEKATVIAAENFVQLHKIGDGDGIATWANIMIAIRELKKGNN